MHSMSSVHFSHIIPLDPLAYQVPNEAAELILIPFSPFLVIFFFWSSQKFLVVSVAGFDFVTANVS